MTEPRVYIVDDDSDLRASLVWLLESVGITAQAYAGPDEFLAAFDPEEPGCLIVDVRMPRVSGFQLQERLTEMGGAVTGGVLLGAWGHPDVGAGAAAGVRWISSRSPTIRSR